MLLELTLQSDGNEDIMEESKPAAAAEGLLRLVVLMQASQWRVTKMSYRQLSTRQAVQWTALTFTSFT